MKILCLKHDPFEGPAAIGDWAERCGHAMTVEASYLGNPLPAMRSFDALFLMGGPMNIHEHEPHPWIVREKLFIREAIRSHKIVVGICLGGQLIADALGAPVRRNKEAEIGWFDIERTHDCPSDLPLPEKLRVCHWHGDTFGIPDGAVRIASNRTCKNQGFLHKDRILGLQCHLETTPASLFALIKAYGNNLRKGRHIMSTEAMRVEPVSTYRNMQKVLFRILDRLPQ